MNVDELVTKYKNLGNDFKNKSIHDLKLLLNNFGI